MRSTYIQSKQSLNKKWVGWQVKKKLELITIASPGNGLCVAMEIYAEESHLDLAGGAGSGHLQAGAGRQGALGLPPPVTAPVICKEDNNEEHMLIRDTRHMQQCWALAWVMTVFQCLIYERFLTDGTVGVTNETVVNKQFVHLTDSF